MFVCLNYELYFSWLNVCFLVNHHLGEILRTIVQELAPKTCLELGTYCGYSAVLMASVLPKGSRLITLEAQEDIAEFAKEFTKLAGDDVNEKVGACQY